MRECVRCLACFEDTEERCGADGGPLQPTLDGPPLVDRKYRLERRLSEGGMGVVYLARHVELQRGFAVKLIRASEAWDDTRFARFRLEAEALGRLEHPGIVDVTDFGVDPRGVGLPYLVMERLEGRSLDEHCRARGPLGADEALPILGEIAAAMDFAHRRGVLHRDLKPANVFLALAPTGGRVVKLLDFGLARLAEDERATPAAVRFRGGDPGGWRQGPERRRDHRAADARHEPGADGPPDGGPAGGGSCAGVALRRATHRRRLGGGHAALHGPGALSERGNRR